MPEKNELEVGAATESERALVRDAKELQKPGVRKWLAHRIAHGALAAHLRARSLGRLRRFPTRDGASCAAPREAEYVTAAFEAIAANIDSKNLVVVLELPAKDKGNGGGRPPAYDLAVVTNEREPTPVLILEAKRAIADGAGVMKDLKRLAKIPGPGSKWLLVVGEMKHGRKLEANEHLSKIFSLEPGQATFQKRMPGKGSERSSTLRVVRQKVCYACGPQFIQNVTKANDDNRAWGDIGVDFAMVLSAEVVEESVREKLTEG